MGLWNELRRSDVSLRDNRRFSEALIYLRLLPHTACGVSRYSAAPPLLGGAVVRVSDTSGALSEDVGFGCRRGTVLQVDDLGRSFRGVGCVCVAFLLFLHF